jgi:hypothetical protein
MPIKGFSKKRSFNSRKKVVKKVVAKKTAVKKKTPWLQHLADYIVTHPRTKYASALKQASKTYKK